MTVDNLAIIVTLGRIGIISHRITEADLAHTVKRESENAQVINFIVKVPLGHTTLKFFRENRVIVTCMINTQGI